MEKIKLASVKFKSAGKVYYFSTDIELDKGDKVVVETARGVELGEISQSTFHACLLADMVHVH